jgi:transposase
MWRCFQIGISVMPQIIRGASLVPAGFFVDRVTRTQNGVEIAVHSSKKAGICPSCGGISRRVHSHYRRRVNDLPLSGQRVQIIVSARRFRCDAVRCGTQIFAERFASDVLPRSARRTGRLEGIVHHLGLALGGRPAASFARRLMMPVSNDALLRVVRRRARTPSTPLRC